MNIRVKRFALGFFSACILGFGSVVSLLYFGTGDAMAYHNQALPSGKSIKVTMCNFTWGAEHDERYPEKDCFLLEYVSSAPGMDPAAKDSETLEAFELIRPVSELWRIDTAEIHAFPSTERKGAYDIYLFKRNPDGKWTFDHQEAKVFIND